MQEYEIVSVRARKREGDACRRRVLGRVEASIPLIDLEGRELCAVHDEKCDGPSGGFSDLPVYGGAVLEIVCYLKKF